MVRKFVSDELANRARRAKQLFRVSPQAFEADSKCGRNYGAQAFVTFESGHKRRQKRAGIPLADGVSR